MIFKAIFGHWMDWAALAINPKQAEKAVAEKDYEFLIEAKDQGSAQSIAKKYENLEIYTNEGIGKLKMLVPATRFDAKLNFINTFQNYLEITNRYRRA